MPAPNDLDLGMLVSQDDIDAIVSGRGTPPSIAEEIRKSKGLRRVKRDSIYSTQRFAANMAAAGNTALVANTYRMFSVAVGAAGQGFVPALTFANTNIQSATRSPFSDLFIARRMNIYCWSTTGNPNNQADAAVDLLLQHTVFTIKKGTSFEWRVGSAQKAACFRGNKLYSVQTNAVGYGIGDGYTLGVPFLISPDESVAAELLVPDPAAQGLTLPATYVVDVKIEFDGDAVELITQ